MSPAGAPLPDAEILAALKATTRQLINAMKADGRLAESPLDLAMKRTVTLHRDAALARLAGKRVLVTGGAGSVGTRLRTLLGEFKPASIHSLDIAPHHGPGIGMQVDVCDAAGLDAAFAEARPDVVFHLAGVREPGRAEQVVRDAVGTNVYGTDNVIAACIKHNVSHAVYSSTGKCYAYITDHVYTASKKLAEMLWTRAARKDSPTAFAMVRFTHVMDNSLVLQDIREGMQNGLVSLHGPDRHFNIQNLVQATHLLINALALAGEQAPDSFWSTADLGWPVNSLELALYEMGDNDAALRFTGVPMGYDEYFFRGQFDWSGDYEMHPLVNALEMPSSFSDSTGTMIGARVQTCPDAVLDRELARLRLVLDSQAEDALQKVKPALIQAVEAIASGIFSTTSPRRLLDVLSWGLAESAPGNSSAVARFPRVVALLTDALLAAQPAANFKNDRAATDNIAGIAAALADTPHLARFAQRLVSAT